jgi:hypothetical protein
LVAGEELATIVAWNPASMRVLETVDFVREGVLRNSVSKDDTLIDGVMYAYIAAHVSPEQTADGACRGGTGHVKPHSQAT